MEMCVILMLLVTDLLKPSAMRKTYSLDFLSSDGIKHLLFVFVLHLVTVWLLRG